MKAAAVPLRCTIKTTEPHIACTYDRATEGREIGSSGGWTRDSAGHETRGLEVSFETRAQASHKYLLVRVERNPYTATHGRSFRHRMDRVDMESHNRLHQGLAGLRPLLRGTRLASVSEDFPERF